MSLPTLSPSPSLPFPSLLSPLSPSLPSLSLSHSSFESSSPLSSFLSSPSPNILYTPLTGDVPTVQRDRKHPCVDSASQRETTPICETTITVTHGDSTITELTHRQNPSSIQVFPSPTIQNEEPSSCERDALRYTSPRRSHHSNSPMVNSPTQFNFGQHTREVYHHDLQCAERRSGFRVTRFPIDQELHSGSSPARGYPQGHVHSTNDERYLQRSHHLNRTSHQCNPSTRMAQSGKSERCVGDKSRGFVERAVRPTHNHTAASSPCSCPPGGTLGQSGMGRAYKLHTVTDRPCRTRDLSSTTLHVTSEYASAKSPTHVSECFDHHDLQKNRYTCEGSHFEKYSSRRFKETHRQRSSTAELYSPEFTSFSRRRHQIHRETRHRHGQHTHANADPSLTHPQTISVSHAKE